MTRRAAVAVATLLALGAPASAGAHALVRAEGGGLSYTAPDATSRNTLEVRAAGAEVELVDRTVDGGMDPGTCRPGDVSADANAWIVQAFCPAAAVTALYVDLGDREDGAVISAPLATTVFGGFGADRIGTGPAADVVAGDAGDDTLGSGAGNDRVTGGAGSDAVAAGPGDDQVLIRDGEADTVTCGEGADVVHADQLDAVAADCEAVARAFVAPSGRARDRIAPRVRVHAARVQRLRGRRTVRLRATSSEVGVVATSGFVDVGGLSLPVRTVRRPVHFAARAVGLGVRLTDGQLRRVRRALRRGRRATVRLGVVATDAAGNSRRIGAPAIALRL